MLVFSLFLILFVDGLSIGLVLPIFAPLFSDPHAAILTGFSSHERQFFYAMIISAPMFFMMVGNPFLGTLSDHYGRKKILLLGLAGVALSMVLSVIALWQASIALLFASRFLAGFMDGTQSLAQAAIADTSTEKKKAKYLAIITLGSSFGFILGPVMGGIFSDHRLNQLFGYPLPFIIASLLVLANILLLSFSFHETFVPKPDAKKIKFWSLLHEMVASCFDRRIRQVGVIFFVQQIAWALYFQGYIFVLSRNYHYTPHRLGYFVAFLSVCFAVTMFLMAKFFLERYRYRTLLHVGMSMACLGLLSFSAFSYSDVWVWFSEVPMAIGLGVCYNVLLALFSDAVTEEEQGRVMGANTAILCLGWLLAGVIFGLASGCLAMVFLLLSVVLLTTWLLLSRHVQ